MYLPLVGAQPTVFTTHTDPAVQRPRSFVASQLAGAPAVTLTLWYRHSLNEPYLVAAHATAGDDEFLPIW